MGQCFTCLWKAWSWWSVPRTDCTDLLAGNCQERPIHPKDTANHCVESVVFSEWARVVQLGCKDKCPLSIALCTSRYDFDPGELVGRKVCVVEARVSSQLLIEVLSECLF